jgi:hypothetical protein
MIGPPDLSHHDAMFGTAHPDGGFLHEGAGGAPIRVVHHVRLSSAFPRRGFRYLAIAVILAIVLVLLPLVLSGHLPPRALVTGAVYHVGGMGGTAPTSGAKFLFQRVASSMVVHVQADSSGRYSATLAPGAYRALDVDGHPSLFWYVGGLLPYSVDYKARHGVGPPEVTVAAGKHVTADFAFYNWQICLAAGDSIATPAGPVLVGNLHAGMMVWTLNGAGGRVAAPVLLVGHRRAAPGQQVVRLTLSDGRVVEASPGHPTADGRHVGELKPSDLLDGSHLTAVERIPYVGDTWDLLPDGQTGLYWANGVPLRSTLSLD